MIQQTLFGETDTGRPLASRMRPRTLEEFAGQRHLLGEGKVLRQLIDGDRGVLGAAWRGQNDACAHHRQQDEGEFH